MGGVNSILSGLFAVLLGPLRAADAWAGLAAVSLLTAAGVLGIFKAVSNQKAIERGKGRMIARLLEMILFKDVVVNLTAFGRVVAADLGYLRRILLPTAVTAVPFSLILIHVSAWFSARPFQEGEKALVTARLRPDLPVMEQALEIESSGNLLVAPGMVRMPSRNETSWELTVKAPGDAWVDVSVNGCKARKRIATGPFLTEIEEERVLPGIWNDLTHPSGPSLPENGPLVSLEARHPARSFAMLGWRAHWLAAHVGLVMLFGLVLMRPLRVVV